MEFELLRNPFENLSGHAARRFVLAALIEVRRCRKLRKCNRQRLAGAILVQHHMAEAEGAKMIHIDSAGCPRREPRQLPEYGVVVQRSDSAGRG